jgi:hypothetical protein
MNNMNFNERFLDMCKRIDIFKYQDVSAKRILGWEYYEIVKKETEDFEEKQKIYRQIYHIERMKYFDKKGFTAKGFLKYLKVKQNNDIKYSKWDKKWRIIIFDIPEKRKKTRDAFRRIIKKMGFVFLQHSIWISPGGNTEDIRMVLKEYKISKYVVLIVTEEISNDLLYRKIFGLNN